MIDCVSITCESCEGVGRVTVTRSRWIGGSRDGYRSTQTADVRCEDCYGTGETYISKYRAAGAGLSPEPPVTRSGCSGGKSLPPEQAEAVGVASATPEQAQPVTFGGHVIDAPGFTADQFERAIARAFVDELQIKPYNGGRYLVHHAGLTSGYVVSRERCTCKAGEVGTPCKHRALICLHEQVRIPAQRKQWAKLNAERPAGRAVA